MMTFKELHPDDEFALVTKAFREALEKEKAAQLPTPAQPASAKTGAYRHDNGSQHHSDSALNGS